MEQNLVCSDCVEWRLFDFVFCLNYLNFVDIDRSRSSPVSARIAVQQEGSPVVVFRETRVRWRFDGGPCCVLFLEVCFPGFRWSCWSVKMTGWDYEAAVAEWRFFFLYLCVCFVAFFVACLNLLSVHSKYRLIHLKKNKTTMHMSLFIFPHNSLRSAILMMLVWSPKCPKEICAAV